MLSYTLASESFFRMPISSDCEYQGDPIYKARSFYVKGPFHSAVLNGPNQALVRSPFLSVVGRRSASTGLSSELSQLAATLWHLCAGDPTHSFLAPDS
jgi:hypothetical protein